MSTDWIKMRVDLRTHPKVVRMATALGADNLRIVGALHAVWSIFDAHSSDGFLDGYTFKAIDKELGFRNFSREMNAIGWLIDVDGKGLEAPRFDEHNGQSAKRRAQETERKRLEREAEKEAEKAATKSGQTSASDADKSVTREEKRREEIEKETTAAARLVDQAADASSLDPQTQLPGTPPKPKPYAVPDCPYAALLEAYHRELAMLPTVSVLNDARREHMRARWREVCALERFDATQGLEWFAWYFAHVAKSKLLTGRGKPNRDTGRVWHATFDWLLLPTNFAKVIDGNYLDERAMA